MTPKEKAKELFDKFSLGYYHVENAKQCALIAVDNLLEEIDTLFMADRVAYWQKVKKEIEKI